MHIKRFVLLEDIKTNNVPGMCLRLADMSGAKSYRSILSYVSAAEKRELVFTGQPAGQRTGVASRNRGRAATKGS